MTQTIIELTYGTDANGNLQIAGGDEQAYEVVKTHLVAIEHDMNNGIASTLYRVDDASDSSDVSNIVGSDSSHTDHGIEGGIVRGLEIQPGTPTSTEVDDLQSRLDSVSAPTPDLSSVQTSSTPATHIFNDLPNDNIGRGPPPWAGGKGGPGAGGGNAPNKSFEQVMKNDFPNVGAGQWVCTHPDHSSTEKNARGEGCSLGHSGDRLENEYAIPHRSPFDPTSFL